MNRGFWPANCAKSEVDVAEENGLLWAYRFGEGPAERVAWKEILASQPSEGPLWIHFDRNHAEAEAWLRRRSGLTRADCDALLAEETRPRCYSNEDALFLILRGVNLNPGAAPDEMITLRIWAAGQRLITLRNEPFQALEEVASSLEAGKGPRDVGALLVQLGLKLSSRVEPVVENLEELAEGLEEGMIEREVRQTRTELAEFRRQVIALRRYLAPQRAVCLGLVQESFPGFSASNRAGLRELADRTTRQVEDLEALRERAGVIHDELASHIAEQLNTRMYVVSLITTIFLPLGLLTGLLGINVGGVPGATEPIAFGVVCGILVAVGSLIAVVFRWLKWL